MPVSVPAVSLQCVCKIEIDITTDVATVIVLLLILILQSSYLLLYITVIIITIIIGIIIVFSSFRNGIIFALPLATTGKTEGAVTGKFNRQGTKDQGVGVKTEREW